MSCFSEPSAENHYLAEHIALLANSYQHFVGKDIRRFWQKFDVDDLAQSAFNESFILVSHNNQPDPVFTYGNLTALNLFEMNWSEFTSLPSRQSAEPPNQEERAQLLEAVTTKGFIEDYRGVRISKTGKRFLIKDVTVWNLIDKSGNYQGQAAICRDWQYLP